MSKLTIIFLAMATVACQKTEHTADAYGNFEADEVIVSAEANGRILEFNIEEGASLKENHRVGLVDTIVPALQMEEVTAQKQRVRANLSSIDAQIAVVEQQKENLQVELNRVQNLIKNGAATNQQLDDLTGKMKVLDKQITATKKKKAAVAQELKVIESKALLLKEQLNKCHIVNPVKGKVLETYASKGEMTGAGRPLYKMANTQNMILRAYIPGSMLHQVQTGKKCTVSIDKGTEEYIDFKGEISWIAEEAEFTPKIIQTKEERVNMVYAVKILVPNNGEIKIGMPGEVTFQTSK